MKERSKHSLLRDSHPVITGFAPSWGQNSVFQNCYWVSHSRVEKPHFRWVGIIANKTMKLLISFCLSVPWDFYHKRQSKMRKAPISAALTTLLIHLHCSQLHHRTITLGKFQLLSCSLLVLPYLEWSVFCIKWDILLTPKLSSSLQEVFPDLFYCLYFLPFCILWPHFHGILSC